MKKFLVVAGVLVAIVAVVVVAGAGMETQHLVTRSRLFGAPPDRVWTALLSIRQLPFDRSDLKIMESPVEKDRLPPSIEVLGSPVRIEATAQMAPVKLVVVTAEPDLAYSGSWTFTLAPEGDTTRLKITEQADIKSKPLRFVVGRILGEDVLLEGIFRAINRKLGETPKTTGGD
jgi:hypothetical protein